MRMTLADHFEELNSTKPVVVPKPKAKRKAYPPDTDIPLWLNKNAPSAFED